MNASTMAYESAELLYEDNNAQALGHELFEAAMRGELALSDFVGCFDLLIGAHPDLYIDVVSAALRLAIDLTQDTARNLDRQPGEGRTARVSGSATAMIAPDAVTLESPSYSRQALPAEAPDGVGPKIGAS